MGVCFSKKNQNIQINKIEIKKVNLITPDNKNGSPKKEEIDKKTNTNYPLTNISKLISHEHFGSIIKIKKDSPLYTYYFYSKIKEDMQLELIWSADPSINRNINYWDDLNLFQIKKRSIRKSHIEKEPNSNDLIEVSKISKLIEENKHKFFNPSSHENNLSQHQKIILTLKSILKYEKEKILKNLIMSPPNNLRWAIWYSIASYTFQDEEIYSKNNSEYFDILSLKLSDKLTEQINKDLHRTAPLVVYFKEESSLKSLFNILKVYALYDPQLGYCQGINIIVANLLLISDGNEQETFLLIKYFFSYLQVREFYVRGFPGVSLYIYLIKELIQIHLPEINNKIIEIGIGDEVWLFKWVQSLFCLIMDLPVVIRLWDCLVAYGLDFIIHFTLGVLNYYKNEIMDATDMCEFIEIFKNPINQFNKPTKQDNNSKNENESVKNLPRNSIFTFDFKVYEYRENLIKSAFYFYENVTISNKIGELKNEFYKNKSNVNKYFEEGSFYSNNTKRDIYITGEINFNNNLNCNTTDQKIKTVKTTNSVDSCKDLCDVSPVDKENNKIKIKKNKYDNLHLSQNLKTLKIKKDDEMIGDGVKNDQQIEKFNLNETKFENFKLDLTSLDSILNNFSFTMNKENEVHNVNDLSQTNQFQTKVVIENNYNDLTEINKNLYELGNNKKIITNNMYGSTPGNKYLTSNGSLVGLKNNLRYENLNPGSTDAILVESIVINDIQSPYLNNLKRIRPDKNEIQENSTDTKSECNYKSES